MSFAIDPKKGNPARFLLRNSRGRRDFLMTMLVIVILAMLLSILFFLFMNFLSLLGTGVAADSEAAATLRSFNDNIRLVILGLCSSVFSLAGAYYLRRSSYDRHYESYTKTKAELGISDEGGGAMGSFSLPGASTLSHPNYDDEEEDI